MDKHEYDRPEDEESFLGRALIFALLALVIVGIFFGIFNTDVFA